MKSSINPNGRRYARRSLTSNLVSPLPQEDERVVNDDGLYSADSLLMLRNPAEAMKRFFDNAIPRDGCWEWRLSKLKNGYGQIMFHKFTIYAHRMSYIVHNGPILKVRNEICHTCDNRSCVNPKHLVAGTRLDNVRDMIQKERASHFKKTHCINGHPRTPENLGPADRNGSKHCKVCSRIRGRITRTKKFPNAVIHPHRYDRTGE